MGISFLFSFADFKMIMDGTSRVSQWIEIYIGDMGSIPGLGRFHMPQELLSPLAATTVAQPPGAHAPQGDGHCNEKLMPRKEDTHPPPAAT